MGSRPPMWAAEPELIRRLDAEWLGLAPSRLLRDRLQAWEPEDHRLDQPQTGAVFTQPTVDVTAHATDPLGVRAMSLTVSGQTVDVVDLGGETLESTTFTWTAPATGSYGLEVAGQNADGTWGAASAVQIVIDLGDSTTTTAVVETTTVPVATPTTPTTVPVTTSTTVPPTVTTCNLGLPEPADITDTSTLTPTLHWTYGGCRTPAEFDVEVSKLPDFLRLEWSAQAPGTERELQVTVGEFCTTYYWRVRTSASDTDTPGPWSSVANFVVALGRCP